LTRIRTWVLVASIAAIRGTPGKFRSMIHNRSGVNTSGCSASIGVQQLLFGLGLVPTGRAGHRRQGGAGERVGNVQVADLRVVGLGLPGRTKRGPVGHRVGHPGHGALDRAESQPGAHRDRR
jgi:hypothetical protein